MPNQTNHTHSQDVIPTTKPLQICQPPKITRIKNTKSQFQQQIDRYQKYQDQMILVSKQTYQNMKKQIEKLQFENYGLRLQLQRKYKAPKQIVNKRSSQMLFSGPYKNTHLDIKQTINQKQQQENERSDEQQQQNLMISCHPNLTNKTSLEDKKNFTQKKKFKKQMEQWSKKIGTSFQPSFKKNKDGNPNSSQQISKSKLIGDDQNQDIRKFVRKSQQPTVKPFDKRKQYLGDDLLNQNLNNKNIRKSIDVLDIKQTQQIQIEDNYVKNVQTTFLADSDEMANNFVSMRQISDQPFTDKQNDQDKKSYDGSFKSQQKKQKKSKLQSKTKKQIPKPQQQLIEAICLFGPSEKILEQQCQESARKFLVPQQILYSSPQNKIIRQRFAVYGTYFYPEEGQVICRKVKQQETNTQANQAIFRKNAKKQDCSIFLFRGDQLWQDIYGANHQYQSRHQANQWILLNQINSGKMLYAFVIPFYDYVLVEHAQKQPKDKPNKSFETMQEKILEHDDHESLEIPSQLTESKKSDRAIIKNIEHKKIKTFIKCKYNLCIFTFYPLVNPMEQLLTTIIDEIKIKRVQKYAECDSDINQVSIQFFTSQIKQISKQIKLCTQKIPTKIHNLTNNELHNHFIYFRNKKVLFNLYGDGLQSAMFSGWAFEILKMFEKDQLYDLFNAVIFDQSICFVCENLPLLTHVIFLFVSVFLHPFSYPYPAISNVFDLQFLDSPFTVTTGVCKSSKWFQQNYQHLNSKKIFVDLNGLQLKIKAKNKHRAFKSQKLRKIFTNFYKKLPDVPQIFKKKETVIRPVTRDQNQNAFAFIQSLRKYYYEEIIDYLPNPEIISYLKNTITEQNQTSKLFHLLKEIQKYVRQSRKQKDKDSFVDALLQQQLFYYYAQVRYGLH